MSRFPFGLPFGWYPVAWSFEIGAGLVERRRYFGADLVVFREGPQAPRDEFAQVPRDEFAQVPRDEFAQVPRGETPGALRDEQAGAAAPGRVHVLDAHCPHLGAHLGVGGKVEGDSIRCPFHGWRFSGEGECLEVPYAKRIPPNARARTYPTRESGGLVWAWYHPAQAEPLFEPPEIPEYRAEDWTEEWTPYEWTIRTHPQEVAENSVDWPHFHEVHLMDAPPEREVRFEGHEIRWHAVTRKNVTTMGGAADEIRVTGRNPGLGSSYVRYTGMGETVIVMGMTPIDDETLHMRFGVIGKKAGRSDEEMAAFHKPYADDMALAVEQDFPIWENKVYRDTPKLCDGDGPVSDFRRWAAQFYA